MKRALVLALLTLPLVVGSSGCGTLLFKERRGQTNGEVDPNVVLMDAFWLIFWIVPGLVAFGVDIGTGAIYLPSGVERGEGPFIKD
jgi:hypothetical protein